MKWGNRCEIPHIRSIHPYENWLYETVHEFMEWEQATEPLPRHEEDPSIDEIIELKLDNDDYYHNIYEKYSHH